VTSILWLARSRQVCSSHHLPICVLNGERPTVSSEPEIARMSPRSHASVPGSPRGLAQPRLVADLALYGEALLLRRGRRSRLRADPGRQILRGGVGRAEVPMSRRRFLIASGAAIASPVLMVPLDGARGSPSESIPIVGGTLRRLTEPGASDNRATYLPDGSSPRRALKWRSCSRALEDSGRPLPGMEYSGRGSRSPPPIG
jgi:hypothetical protein